MTVAVGGFTPPQPGHGPGVLRGNAPPERFFTLITPWDICANETGQRPHMSCGLSCLGDTSGRQGAPERASTDRAGGALTPDAHPAATRVLW